uniref:Carboxylesterase 1 n=1 Tax=Streltzoviella insularis TaxID=1206366 RepID=A0A7D5UMQ0_9NEOP|nr:carboxylesterase 1 [Streltzoviella insularis]
MCTAPSTSSAKELLSSLLITGSMCSASCLSIHRAFPGTMACVIRSRYCDGCSATLEPSAVTRTK